MAKKTRQSIGNVTPEPSSVPEVAKEQILSDSTVHELNGVSAQLSEEVPLEKTNKKLFIFGSIIFAVAVVASGLTYYFAIHIKSQKNIAIKIVPKIKQVHQAIVPLKRNEITLEILNGSDIAGLASKTAKKFEVRGYRVIKTGNAEKLKENQLSVDNNIAQTISVLLDDAREILGIGSISGQLTDSTASARIIIIKDIL